MADPAPEQTSRQPAEVTPLPRPAPERKPDREKKPSYRAPARRRPARVARAASRFLLLVVAPLAGAVVGAGYWMEGGRFVTTDNAYIRADKVAVAAEVEGRVTEVMVSTNDTVTWGTPLFRIDDAPFRVALEEAEAQLSMVRTEIAVLRALYRRKQEELALARADARYFESEFERQNALAERQVIAGARIDEVRHELSRARRSVAIAERELGEVLARLGGDPETPDERFARYNNARAKRDRRALDLENTVIRAPADGIAARVSLRPGTFVAVGEPVIALVETAGIWLEANLKESDLTHVAVGQPATVTVDAWPDREWQAHITSFSPATGAEFSLLPPQNATGNWVKVVQRVPVRFRIAEQPGDPPLRVGMSATVSIDTGHERELPDFVESVLARLDAVVGGGPPDL